MGNDGMDADVLVFDDEIAWVKRMDGAFTTRSVQFG
jgi:hypothetical protein